MDTTLIIMAAGMGSRYGGLKQIDSVGPNGETLIDYALFDAKRAGFRNIVFVIRHEFEKEFKNRVSKSIPTNLNVNYAYQELDKPFNNIKLNPKRVKPWGTAHAVLSAKAFINGPFVVQNADDFYGYDAYQKIFNALNKDDDQIYMVGYHLVNTLSPHGYVSRGICKTLNNELKKIDEHKEIIFVENKKQIQSKYHGDDITLDEDTVCSMNFWGFPYKFMENLEIRFIDFLNKFGNEIDSEWYIPEVVAQVVKDETSSVKVLSTFSKWLGITYLEDKEYVIKELSKKHMEGEYPPSL